MSRVLLFIFWIFLVNVIMSAFIVSSGTMYDLLMDNCCIVNEIVVNYALLVCRFLLPENRNKNVNFGQI